MTILHDEILGDVAVRRHRQSRSFRATVAADGNLRVTVPYLTPMFLVKRQLASSRQELQTLLDRQPAVRLYDGMSIGKSHSLHCRQRDTFSIQIHGQQLIVQGPAINLSDTSLVAELTPYIFKILRKEAKHYLPKRLSYLAEQYGFSYQRIRFSHASSRWGSCSSNGTISLNIGLMNLPFELIDYVLLHELSHTKQMNHSSAFWQLVEMYDPAYKQHRKDIKKYNPQVIVPPAPASMYNQR